MEIMLYVLYGTDQKRAREKLHKLTEVLLLKKPDASSSYVDEETFSGAYLESLIKEQGLFESKQIIVLSNIFKNKDIKDFFLTHRKAVGFSSNIFFLIEGALDKATVLKLQKVSEKVELFGESLRTVKKEKEFSIFTLADALGARDRKKLWVLYQKAKRLNIADEEIHGVLFWQTKNMLLVARTENLNETGLNPFVYKKAQAFLKNYSKKELEFAAETLVVLSHDARRGKHDFAIALEKFILEV